MKTLFLLIATQLLGQTPGVADPAAAPHHDHAAMLAAAAARNQGPDPAAFLMEQASGTSMNPKSWMMPMIAAKTGSWNWMFMGQAYLVDTQQSGSRGYDKFYSPNWFMAMAGHKLGKGAISIDLMASLDPLTVTDRRYPLLFQTGETAFGKPIVDGQHPHDLLMGLGVRYARAIAKKTMLQLYYAPTGDPALGPVAFPHRASAAELPQATLGHHWQDSTHIASNVVTAGISRGIFRVEASGFHGMEPNENRWNIDFGAIDSWSSRLSVSPTKNWMGQVSVGRLQHPEASEEGDVVRATASLHYTKAIGSGAWSSSFIWGRNHKTHDRSDTNSFALESVAPVKRKNFVTGRFEMVDKDELELPGVHRIGAYIGGYTRDIGSFGAVQAGLGANLTAYTIPDSLKAIYGNHPWGVNVFARFRLRPPE